MGPASCATQRFGQGGEGRAEDWFLGNSVLRAIIRHPLASVTLPGLGGGTLVDAARWGRPDLLHEAVPLVGGGWLVVDTLEPDDDGLTVSGVVRSLPDRQAAAEGERRSVRWSLAADDPWLRLDGADGIWVNPSGGADLLDGWLVAGRTVLGHDGRLVEDLGGVVRIEGLTGLLFGTTDDAWAQRPGPHRAVAGDAPLAEEVRLLRGGQVVGVLPVTDGRYAGTIPTGVDALVAVASGRTPSPPTPPGDEVPLTVGAAATLDVRLGWPDARPRPVLATWTTLDGREVRSPLGPTGGVLPLGPGIREVVLTGGPDLAPRTVRVELADNDALALPVVLTPSIQPGPLIAATFAWPGARSRTVRASANDRTRAAITAGFQYAVITAEDDVSTASTWFGDAPWIRTDDATTLTHPDGWRLTAWPWSANARLAGHGAPSVRSLNARDALALASGGAPSGRHFAVDLGWLRAVDDPIAALAVRPTHLVLDPPGPPPFDAWAPWFRWLDASAFLLPVGPVTWLDIVRPATWGPVELERAVTRGRLAAGSGPWLWISVDGAGPGEVMPRRAPPAADTDTSDTDDSGEEPEPPAPVPRRVQVIVQAGHHGVDRVSLVGSGVVLATWPVETGYEVFEVAVEPGRWLLAIAWSTSSDAWAVTAPVYTSPPTGPQPGNDRPEPPR